MPEGSPFLRRLSEEHFQGVHPLSIAQRLLHPMKDAAFGYHLVSPYFDAGEELPKHWPWPELHRTYRCLQNPLETKRTDPACHEALALGHPANVQAQAALKGYLCSGLGYEPIAGRRGKSVEVVRIFARLYCDFPERSDSPEFVRGVLDPQNQRGPFDLDLAELVKIEDPILRAMNIGYSYGPDALASLTEPYGSRELNKAHLIGKVQDNLLIRADRQSLFGRLKSKDPEFISFLEAVAHQREAKQESGPQRSPLEALSGVKAVQSEIDGMFQGQIGEQLQAANGLPNSSTEPPSDGPKKA